MPRTAPKTETKTIGMAQNGARSNLKCLRARAAMITIGGKLAGNGRPGYPSEERIGMRVCNKSI